MYLWYLLYKWTNLEQYTLGKLCHIKRAVHYFKYLFLTSDHWSQREIHFVQFWNETQPLWNKFIYIGYNTQAQLFLAFWGIKLEQWKFPWCKITLIKNLFDQPIGNVLVFLWFRFLSSSWIVVWHLCASCGTPNKMTKKGVFMKSWHHYPYTLLLH